MFGIGTLDGTLPCFDCKKKIAKGEWGTSNGAQDFCKECSDKRWGHKSAPMGFFIDNEPVKNTPRFVDKNLGHNDTEQHAIWHCCQCATYDDKRGWLGNSCILKFTNIKFAPRSKELVCPLRKTPIWVRRQ